MLDVEMLSYKISKLSVVNNLDRDCRMKLIYLVSSHCKWDGGMLLMTITAALRQYGHPERFCIELEMEGRFLVDGVINTEDKKDIHIMGYQKLIVHVNEILSVLAKKNSGMGELDIQISSLKPEDIHSGSKPDAAQQEKIIKLRPKNE